MNKVIIFITGIFALTLLSGCVSARLEQNPQPKAEILCKEWGKYLPESAKKQPETPYKVIKRFIEACEVNDFENMPEIDLRYNNLTVMERATIEKIADHKQYKDSWIITVYCPNDSNRRTISLHKMESQNPEDNTKKTIWKISDISIQHDPYQNRRY